MLTAWNQPFARAKTYVCFTYRIYPVKISIFLLVYTGSAAICRSSESPLRRRRPRSREAFEAFMLPPGAFGRRLFDAAAP